jgi:3-oxoacyl-ACP reductase-like protein
MRLRSGSVYEAAARASAPAASAPEQQRQQHQAPLLPHDLLAVHALFAADQLVRVEEACGVAGLSLWGCMNLID